MGKKMPDRVFKSRTISDRDYIKENGDAVTDFVASRDDLSSLASGLVQEILTNEIANEMIPTPEDVDALQYTLNRLERFSNTCRNSKRKSACG